MPNERSKLLVATNNKDKLAELNDLLVDVPIDLLSLGDIGITDEIEETGLTFGENAVLKASGYAQRAGILTLADDSGLEVEALENRPGVYSARYGGAELGFDEKMLMLLDEIEKTGDTQRKARFVCSMAIANPEGEIVRTSEGICSGTIAENARGTGGFGYDPLFIPDGFEKTFGELPNDVKQKISHRFRAFCEIMPFLRTFTAI
ncbi:MAG: RdgB/HAM1 family non-canonical purine NTP pyrophosphatase [Pyrinomonadaceae bacterium]